MSTHADRFEGPLVIEEIGYELWRIHEPFEYVTVHGSRIKIPAGFETDLASVPALARSLVPKIGYWSQPAVVHDYMYALHRAKLNTEWTRKDADLTFKSGMEIKEEEYEIPNFQRKASVLYAAVRMGGLAGWETPEEREERLSRVRGFNKDLI